LGVEGAGAGAGVGADDEVALVDFAGSSSEVSAFFAFFPVAVFFFFFFPSVSFS
jgi:hypothetical protein